MKTPEQLAEERYPITDLCINCGADYGLHHADTNQCPKNGREAIWDRKQEWQNTCWISDDNRKNQQAFIAGYNEANSWIDVNDRLPEQDEEVRIWTCGQEVHGEYRIPEDKRKKPYWEEYNSYYPALPTHWQPIIPPKN